MGHESTVNEAITLLNAIQHNNHILLDKEEGASIGKELFELPGGSQNVERQKSLVIDFIAAIDDAVAQIDEELDIAQGTVFRNSLDSVEDSVKNVVAEIETVKSTCDEINSVEMLLSTDLVNFKEIYSNRESLVVQHSEIHKVIAALSLLQRWYNTFQRAEDALQNGQLVALREERKMLGSIVVNLDNQMGLTKILPSLKEKTYSITVSMDAALIVFWNKLVYLEGNELEMTLKINAGCEEWDTVLANLNECSILQQKILSLGGDLKQHFVQPLLTRSYSITKSETALIITKHGDLISFESILHHLSAVVTFLTKFPQPILDLIIPSLTPSLTTDVADSFSSSAHIALDDLPSFISLCDEVSKFDRFLVDAKWVSHSPLSNWSTNPSRIWYSARLARYLMSTRALIIETLNQRGVLISSGVDIMDNPQSEQNKPSDEKSADTDSLQFTLEESNDGEDETDAWGFENSEDDFESDKAVLSDKDSESDGWNWDLDEPHTNKPGVSAEESLSFPYSISSLPDALMRVVESILEEGVKLQSAKYSTYGLAKDGKNYPKMIPLVLAMWRAFISLTRKDMTLAKRMRASNDALYLAHRLALHSIDDDIVREVQMLNLYGQSCFNQEVDERQTSITNILEITNGFSHCSKPEQSQRCKAAIESVKNELISLSKTYKSILPPSKYRAVMGILVNNPLSYVNTSLAQIEDISADDSTVLIEIYTSLFALKSLFEPFGPELFCSDWLRSQYIRELLEWRMVDIMESWREGLLQGVFTRSEMAEWLRKLFQDSPTRGRNISEILTG